MNTPVNYPIAKLLKEKGYNEPCALLYDENGKISGTKMSMAGHPNIYINKYSAPTIAEVVMWLYEKHGVWISVTQGKASENFGYRIQGRESFFEVNYTRTTPTEAYEAAIEYVLTNLI
jgi:hypothetical protein